MEVKELPARRRKGGLVPPLVAEIDGPSLLAEIDAAKDGVRLVDLRPRIGLTSGAQHHLIAEGLLETMPGRARREGYVVSKDEACVLLLGALLAVAAGIAIATMLRGLKGAGMVGAVAAEAIRNLP
jgi:hypothetical protein